MAALAFIAAILTGAAGGLSLWCGVLAAGDAWRHRDPGMIPVVAGFLAAVAVLFAIAVLTALAALAESVPA